MRMCFLNNRNSVLPLVKRLFFMTVIRWSVEDGFDEGVGVFSLWLCNKSRAHEGDRETESR